MDAHLAPILSQRKRGRRKSKDKIRDLKIPISTGKSGDGELDLHAWGLGELKKEIRQFSAIVGKCVEIFEGEVGPVTRLSNSLPLFGDQMHKWRASRLKAQVISIWKATSTNLTKAETTFHIWLEAIQTKKRLMRADGLMLVDELDISIAFHEQRLDAIDDKMDECKALAVVLKKQCHIFAAMKLFLEDQNHQRSQTQNQTLIHETEEDEVFTGYSCDSGRAIRPSDVVLAKTEFAPFKALNSPHKKKNLHI